MSSRDIQSIPGCRYDVPPNRAAPAILVPDHSPRGGTPNGLPPCHSPVAPPPSAPHGRDWNHTGKLTARPHTEGPDHGPIVDDGQAA